MPVPLSEMSDHDRNSATPAPVVAFFDVDNTLLRGASVYHVSRAAWKRGLVRWRDVSTFAWHQARFIAVGENKRHITSAQERALRLAKGHPTGELRKLTEEVYAAELETRLWPETVALTRDHLARGHEVWLITAAPIEIAEVIARNLGLTGALGTILGESDGCFTGELDGPILHGGQKAIAARALASERQIDLADCWAYSDSRNDIPLLTLVGNRVVVNPDAALRAHAKTNHWRILTLDPARIRETLRRTRQQARATERRDRTARS